MTMRFRPIVDPVKPQKPTTAFARRQQDSRREAVNAALRAHVAKKEAKQ